MTTLTEMRQAARQAPHESATRAGLAPRFVVGISLLTRPDVVGRALTGAANPPAAARALLAEARAA